MTVKSYKFGDIVFRITSPCSMKEDSRFESFAVGNDEKYDFHYIIKEGTPGKSDITVRREKNIIYAYMDVSFIPDINISVFLSNAGAEKYILEKNAFILHSSYVYNNEEAILFSAPSETGKSTQAKLWHECRNTLTVNEDRSLIYKKDGRYYASGCWATGRARTCMNISSPLKAVILLRQGRYSEAKEISAVEKFTRLLPQCSFDEKNKNQKEMIVDLLSDFINNVKILDFAAEKNKSAVDYLERYI